MRKPPLGTGQRFAALKKRLARKKGVYSPGGLAATIGRKKYGATRMAEWSARGRRRTLREAKRAIRNK